MALATRRLCRERDPAAPQFCQRGPSPPKHRLPWARSRPWARARSRSGPWVPAGARTATPPPRGCSRGAHTRDAGARMGQGSGGPRPSPRAFSGFGGTKSTPGACRAAADAPHGWWGRTLPAVSPPLTWLLLRALGHAGAGRGALLLLSGLPGDFGAAVLVALLLPFLLLLLPQLLHPWAFQATP